MASGALSNPPPEDIKEIKEERKTLILTCHLSRVTVAT